MKQLKEIIFEKLKINKNSKSIHNVDDLTNDDITLYDDQECDDEDMQDMQWDYCQNILNEINKKFDGFVVCRWKSLTKSTDLEKSINDYSADLDCIKERIITGKDLGYEVKIVKGHLEFYCVNSGSRATFYVYALSNKGYELIKQYFDEPESLDVDSTEDKLKFLFDDGIILPIEAI